MSLSLVRTLAHGAAGSRRIHTTASARTLLRACSERDATIVREQLNKHRFSVFQLNQALSIASEKWERAAGSLIYGSSGLSFCTLILSLESQTATLGVVATACYAAHGTWRLRKCASIHDDLIIEHEVRVAEEQK